MRVEKILNMKKDNKTVKETKIIPNTNPTETKVIGENEVFKEQSVLGKWLSFALIFTLCAIIFSNIYDHQYVLDDLPTIQGNRFVQQGFKGFKDILTTRAWDGYNKDINIAAYRPMQLLMYAVEFEMYGFKPGNSHVMNICYYTMLCFFLYSTLILMFRGKYAGLPLMITLIFAAHPLHSEVVSNLKSRDELIALMFAIMAMYFLFKFVEVKKIVFYGISVFLYFLAMLSKETPVCFLAIYPVTLYFFTDWNLKKIAVYTLPFIGTFLVYFAIRAYVFNLAGNQYFQHTFLQNPILAAVGSQKLGTKMYVLGKYLQLMFFPYELTFSYFFNGIPLTKVFEWKSVVSILSYLTMIGIAIKLLKKKHIISYGIIFYLAGIALFSHFFVSPGDAMGERLAFTASLGFCIAIAYLFWTFINYDYGMTIGEFFKKNGFAAQISILLFLGAVGMLSFKTYDRNMAWHDNFTLCLTDVETSPESYILNRQLGLTYLSFVDTVPTNKAQNLKTALKYFQKAVELDPNNPALWQKYGEGLIASGDFGRAKGCFQASLNKQPNNPSASIKLGECQRRLNEFDAALKTLDPLVKDPQYQNAYFLNREVALNYYFLKKYAEAIPFFQKALQFSPNANDKAIICGDIGALYINMGNVPEALKFFLESTKLNPNYDISHNGTGVAYYQMGMKSQQRTDFEKAAEYFENAAKLNAGNAEAINNALSTYTMLKNEAKVKYYTELYQRVTGKK